MKGLVSTQPNEPTNEKSLPQMPLGLQHPGSEMPPTAIGIVGQLASGLPGWFVSTQPLSGT